MSATLFSPILVTSPTRRLGGSRALPPLVSLGNQFISEAFAKPDGSPPVRGRIPLAFVRCDPAHLASPHMIDGTVAAFLGLNHWETKTAVNGSASSGYSWLGRPENSCPEIPS